MATEILMPKLGLTMTEGTVEKWYKAEGEAVKKGDFTPDELEAAKRSVSGDYRTVSDSAFALENYYLDQALIGPDCAPNELAQLASEITAQDVVEIAQGVECDAIYFLRGKKEAE